MNITTFSLILTSRNGHRIRRDNVIKFMTQYSTTIESDFLTLFYVRGKEYFILKDINKIEVVC